MIIVVSDFLISVVIPTYNYGHMLPRALESVLAQLSDEVELIVVDDGSTDDTAEVLNEYSSGYPRIQVIRQDNAGPAAARNNGIRMARGRYVLLLDADDELVESAIETLSECVTNNLDVGLVLGGHVSVYPDGYEKMHMPTAVKSTSSCTLARRYLLQKRISISHGCSLFRRDILVKSPYPEHFRGGEDIPVFLHMLINGPVTTIKRPLARINKHAGSLRRQHDGGEQRARWLVDEVFSKLPVDCQSLKRRYEAQRYLSLFRTTLLAGQRADARRFYLKAVRLHFFQAIRWTYLRKALRLWKI